MRSLLLALTLLFSSSVMSYGQNIPIEPDTIGNGAALDFDRDNIAEHYYSNEWKQLQREVKSKLNRSYIYDDDGTLKLGGDYFDFESNHYLINFLDSNDRLINFIVHKPAPMAYTNVIPWSSKQEEIYQVTFYEDNGDSLLSLYQFSKKENPVSSQIPGFGKVIVPNLASIFNSITTLTGEKSNKLIPPGVDPSEYLEKIKKSSTPFTISKVTVPLERAEVVIKHSYKNGSESETIDTEIGYLVSPTSHWSFGLLTGAFLSFTEDSRYVLSDNVIEEKTIPRPMTMAIINYHPWGYNAAYDYEDYTYPEKVRFFGGIVATPEFGIGGGASFNFYKGASLNLGYSAMIVNDLKAGDTIGDAPDNFGQPFELGFRGGLFVAFSYNFEE